MTGASDQNAAAALYRDDYTAWLDVQAAALRERRFLDLDLDNLFEEVEGVRRAELRSVQHHARVVIAHTLEKIVDDEWLPTNVYGFDRFET